MATKKKKTIKNKYAKVFDDLNLANATPRLKNIINSNPDVTFKRIQYDTGIYYIADNGNAYNESGLKLCDTVTTTGYIRFRSTSRQRIVCFAFGLLKDINDRTYDCDHIDNDKSNNNLSNLRLISHRENISKRDINGCPMCKKIDAYVWKTGEFYKTFNSGREAAKELNVKTSNLSYCLSGKVKSAGGYTFAMHGEKPIYTYADLTRKYHEQYKNGRAHSGTRIQLHQNRYIYKKIDPKTLEVVETYDSANKIRDTLNLDKSSIYHCVKKDGRYKTVGGYIWEREENPHYKEPIL